jgi:osmotically-inducible protein OsmY
MLNVRKWVWHLFTALVALNLVACAPTADRRGTGEYVDDKAITAKVKTALIGDQGIRGATDINVETFRGVVQLSGFVESQDMASRAVSRARQVEGVRSVENALRLRAAPPGAPRS